MLVKFGRFQKEGSIFYGIVEGEEVYEIGAPEKVHKLSELRPLCPIIPTKVVAVGLNYKDHAEELGLSIPDEPLIFLKPTSALVGPEDAIILPPESREVHYEGELAVIIGKEIYRPRAYKQIEEAILGYTCFNDVTARDLQRKDGQWTRAKVL
jgi:2-keto-4-pentenoate hydratase/2-oxohepta-3-ene-1,7-dioic acid hydratase in catechol pathway